MSDDFTSWPADADAGQVWRTLWAAGINVPHPMPGQTAADWLASLTDEQLSEIHQYAQEATPHD